jgi:hypothetical protein
MTAPEGIALNYVADLSQLIAALGGLKDNS